MVAWLCYTALCSGFSVHDTNSKSGKIITLYILISLLLDSKRENNPPCSDHFSIRSVFATSLRLLLRCGRGLCSSDMWRRVTFIVKVKGPFCMKVHPFELKTTCSF